MTKVIEEKYTFKQILVTFSHYYQQLFQTLIAIRFSEDSI